MEQERKIEKWLKAYANKRRGRAGDSFKLDPATRHILQNEISRAAEHSENEDETMSLWELLRKHWLYLLGFAACVFVLAALCLPTLNAPMSRSFRASSTLSIARSSRNVRAITNSNTGLATLTPPPPPAALSDRSLAQPAAPEPALDKLETAAASLPAARPEFNGPATSHKAVPPASADQKTRTTGIPATAAPGNYAMNSMPANATKTGEPRGEASRNFGGGGLAFVPASRKDYLETAASPAQSAAVLVNFQVSQNGNTIRVVDQDGSVYTGTLEAEGYENNSKPGAVSSWAAPANLNDMAGQNATAQKTESPKLAQFDSLGGSANKENNASLPPGAVSSGMSQATTELPATVGPQAPMQKYFFHAEGTNQTLNQSVVFAGTLMEDLSLMANTQQTFGMSANARQFVRSAMTNQPIRIQGVAIIDQSYKIQINATPVAAKSSSPPKN